MMEELTVLSNATNLKTVVLLYKSLYKTVWLKSGTIIIFSVRKENSYFIEACKKDVCLCSCRKHSKKQ